MIWQHILPQHLLSRLVGWLAHSRVSWIKNTFIQWFIHRYSVDMRLAEEPNPRNYPHFNAFFTRALKSEMRPVDMTENTIVSPADGAISQIGWIESGRIFQAKQFYFNVQELLGNDPAGATMFQQGHFATIYLAPKDYHRVHMPMTGRLTQMIYIPGRLFSVNTQSAEQIPNLFARNERLVALFDTDMGQMAIVLVGAMIVASIETVWAGLIAPARSNRIQRWHYLGEQSIVLKKGEEMGRFQLGSTVILLLPSGVSWHQDRQAQTSVCMGQSLGTYTCPT